MIKVQSTLLRLIAMLALTLGIGDVAAQPIITKSFTPAGIASGANSTLTITLTNPTAVEMTGATFTDVFPTSPGALTVASPPLRNNGCGGKVSCAILMAAYLEEAMPAFSSSPALFPPTARA